jgi:DNA-binding FadR family transcriptional regulator
LSDAKHDSERELRPGDHLPPENRNSAGLKFGKRVLEAHARILEPIKARNDEASSRAKFAHICDVEAQLENIHHKSKSIINLSLPTYCAVTGGLQKKEGHESRPDITI